MSENIIRQAYYDPLTGFSGVDKLFNKLKSQGITKTQITNFLKSQEVYQRNLKNTQTKNSFVPRYPLQEFQIDLIYIEDPHLNQARYGLSCIDAFTKQADIELIKKRTKIQTATAMLTLIDRMGVPKIIYCDEGSEFDNEVFKQLCLDMNIELIFTFTHATMIERFNRTIKEMMNKYLQSTNSKTITNALPKLIKNYNNSYHTTIGMTPNEVNKETQHFAQVNIINHAQLKPTKPIQIGTQVRLELKPKSFKKGYKPKFSRSLHEVTSKDKNYYYVDHDLKRGYFRSNLQVVTSVELNPEKPDLENTLEGRLKTKKISNSKYEMPELTNIQERQGMPTRTRKPTSQLESNKYGRINF